MLDWIDDFTDRDWQQTTRGTVRFALIGVGWWTTDVVIPALEECDLCTATTLVSSSKEKAERTAAENGIDHGITYDEFHDGEGQEHFDAIYIATPNALHLEYAETAATLDKAVLCEKPMEATVERSEAMVEACEIEDVPLMIGYRMHCDPAIRRARELIQAGFLGDLVQVYGNNSQRILDINPSTDQWRLRQDLSGYGTSVMDLGIYPINTTRFLLRREPTSVSAQMASDHDAFTNVPDERSGWLFELEGGIPMICTSTQHGYEDTQLKITGTEGQIDVHPAFHGDCYLTLNRNDVTVEVRHEEFDVIGETVEMFDLFADRVLSGDDLYANGRHGLRDMEIIKAVHDAAETDETVYVS